MIRMLLKDIYEYITSDPIRILSMIGGAGGLVYWYDRYKNRTRLKVKVINMGLVSRDENNRAIMLIELENLGTLPNSIEEDITLSGIIPKCVPGSTGLRKTYYYKLKAIDRSLPPHKPIVFKAFADTDDTMAFLWFMILILKTSRGGTKKIYIRSASNNRLPWYQYFFERNIRYGIFNSLNID